MITEFQGEHRWLSNFSDCEVLLDGVTYPSVENAYQASKSLVASERIKFESVKAGKAKRLGKKITIRSEWDSVKLGIMEELTRQKFSKEPFKSKLIDTGNLEIQEGNSWGDIYWGICDGKGENNLGKIIMKVRSDLSLITEIK